MSRSRFDLCDGDAHRGGVNFQSLQAELVANCAARRVFLFTIDTLRSIEEQEANVAKGVSKTMNSLHLAQQTCGLAHAFDVVPVNVVEDGKITELEWDAASPDWDVVAEEAAVLGLRAGFTNSSGKRWDLGHIQRPGEHAKVSVRNV
jgi:hypothetical protein